MVAALEVLVVLAASLLVLLYFSFFFIWKKAFISMPRATDSRMELLLTTITVCKLWNLRGGGRHDFFLIATWTDIIYQKSISKEMKLQKADTS